MKRRSLITVITLMLIFILPVLYAKKSYRLISLYEWQTPISTIISKLPAGTRQLKFNPNEKPNYKNKIMRYITAIDPNFSNKITILRIFSKPEIDYLFFNGKLCSVLANWGHITSKKEAYLLKYLESVFGKPSVQKDKNFHIYSYKNNKTKVLLYRLKLQSGKIKCKIYYYTKKLFRMLILE